jgi:hypothetical protein
MAKALAGVRPGTLLDYTTEVYGVHKGAVVAAHIGQMVLSEVELGREPSAREYGELWGVNMRTAFMHREEARTVFGDDYREVLTQLAASVRRRMGDEPPRWSDVAQLKIAL